MQTTPRTLAIQPTQIVKTVDHFLSQLQQLLTKVEQHEASSPTNSHLLETRLHPDMFPLKVQVRVACSFALRSCLPLYGCAIPALSENIDQYDDLAALIAHTQMELANLTGYRDKDEGVTEEQPLPPSQLTDKAGFRDVALNTNEFLQNFALPNFYFHISMVYAMAKSVGASITKGDFDGLHEYPKGFSWEAPQA